MNKPDFDFSVHVEVPDEWIEKALAIPGAQAKKPRILRFPSRRLIAAAAVIPVLARGMYLYFSFH